MAEMKDIAENLRIAHEELVERAPTMRQVMQRMSIISRLLKMAWGRKLKCDYCGKLRPEEKTLTLDDGTVICVLCLAGEVEHDEPTKD